MRLNRPDRKRRPQSAHTLAEVMVAALILGTMAVSLFAGFSAGFAIIQMVREDERATQILSGKIEAMRLCKWRDLTNYSVIPFQEHYDPPRTNDPPGFTNSTLGALYVGSISVTTITNASLSSAPYANNMRSVTVQVQWSKTDRDGTVIQRQRQMQTLVAQYGMQNDPWDPPP